MGFFNNYLNYIDPLQTRKLVGIDNGDKGGGGNEATIDTIDTRNPDQKRIDSTFANFIETYLPQFSPGESYSGNFTAGASPFENQGLGFLQQFLDAPKSKILPAAQDQVLKTLGGQFDPKTSEYFQALRDQAKVNQDEAIDVVNRETAGRGNFFSSERIREIGDVAKQTANFLNIALTDLANEERDRQVGILNEALAVDADYSKEPLKKVAAAMSFGALPRELNQNELEALYQDFLRVREEKALPATLAAGSVSNRGLTTIANNPAEEGGGAMDFLGPILQSAASAATTALIAGCYVAREIFGTWNHPSTHKARLFLSNVKNPSLREFYVKYGEEIAAFIRKNPILKERLRPLFERIAEMGGRSWQVA